MFTFFRQYKLIARRIQDFIRSQEDGETANQKLTNRVFIMNMHSLIYNQLQAPIFEPMLKYAWQKSGYIINEPITEFLNVTEDLFKVVF